MRDTLFIPIFTQAESKNLLLSSVLPILKERSDLEIVIFTQDRKIESYTKRFGAPNVHIEPMADLEYSKGTLEQLISMVGYNSIPTRTIWMRQNRTLYLHPSLVNYILHPFKKMIWVLGHLRLWRELIRKLEMLFHEDHIWNEAFKKYKPTLVFGTMHDNSITLMKAARRHRVPVIGMTKSWDNFTSKTLLRVKPDHLIVNNPVIKKEAIAIGDMPENKVTVVGLPQYDDYLDPQWRLPREVFFAQFGLDPNRKLIVYFMGGPLSIHDPRDHVKMLSNAIERGELPPSQVLVRSHPNYDVSLEELKSLTHVHIHVPGQTLGGLSKDREFDASDMKELISTLYYCDVTMNTGSTMTIEATIFDKPIILIGFDGYTKKPHFESIDHTMDITHYRYMVNSGAARRVVTEKEFITAVHAYLENPALNTVGRKKLFDEQVWQIGGSGERLAKAVLDHLP